jgi:UDP-N-acetylmuramoylalanine--D-glutamate ligase
VSGEFAGVRAVVVGAGIAGRAAATALAEEGAQVRVTDRRDRHALGALEELEDAGVEVRTGRHDPSDLDGATVLVASPGIPPSAEVLAWARDRGIDVWSEMELGARLVRAPYLAVTGTNGKTTTTGMLAACLRAGGVDAVACGNIGHPFPTAARGPHEVLVVEVSSFQLALQDSFHPRVSVLLNVAPDHLDWHGTFEEYAEAKARIYRRQGAGDVHVGNRDDDAGARVSSAAPCETRWFRLGAPDVGEVGFVGDALTARLSGDLALVTPVKGGSGYRADAAAAAAAALAFGAAPEAIARGLAAYEPPHHRGEVVAESLGVRFVDNSKATNVHAALAALRDVHDAVLIAGGRAKGQDLSPLATMADRLRGVVAIGESAQAVVAVFEGAVPVHPADSIEEATRLAFEAAAPGATVLLAPACASWDQFADYGERGARFAAAARAIAAEVAADA